MSRLGADDSNLEEYIIILFSNQDAKDLLVASVGTDYDAQQAVFDAIGDNMMAKVAFLLALGSNLAVNPDGAASSDGSEPDYNDYTLPAGFTLPTFLDFLPGKLRMKRQDGGTLTPRQAKIYTRMFVKNVNKLRRILKKTKLCQKYTELEALMDGGTCEEISAKLQEIRKILNDNNLIKMVLTTYYFKELLANNLQAVLRSGQLFNFIRKLRTWANIVNCIVPGQSLLAMAGKSQMY